MLSCVEYNHEECSPVPEHASEGGSSRRVKTRVPANASEDCPGRKGVKQECQVNVSEGGPSRRVTKCVLGSASQGGPSRRVTA